MMMSSLIGYHLARSMLRMFNASVYKVQSSLLLLLYWPSTLRVWWLSARVPTAVVMDSCSQY